MNKKYIAFFLLFISLFLYQKNLRKKIDEKIESLIYYPYFYLSYEINSLLYIRNEKIEIKENFFRLKEKIPLFVNFPIYYDKFPYPEKIILKGEGEKGDVVVSQGALVGKVIDKNGNLLTVRTIFDNDFKCSLISKYNILSLYQGTGEKKGLLNFYPIWAEIKKGDTLYTSGLTENFPKGIPAFIVDSISKNKGEIFYEIYVNPLWNPEIYGFYYTVPPKP